jgi:protein-S-isoprenylcysteine O-methyltransferase Ste14
MTRPPPAHERPKQPEADAVVRIGAWLFRRRTWLPLPLALAILLVPGVTTAPGRIWSGLAIVAAGEALRLWAVRHIGVVSRTRIDRSGPLVASGPFAHVRNPLYLGNIALWLGFATVAGSPWPMLPAIALFLGVEYHAIVRWEETLLDARLGQSYRDYRSRVPRWLPTPSPGSFDRPGQGFSWRETLFSERGTLVAIAAGLVLAWAKQFWQG